MQNNNVGSKTDGNIENCKPLTTDKRERWTETVIEALLFAISENNLFSAMKLFPLCRICAIMITLKSSLANEVAVADKGKHWIYTILIFLFVISTHYGSACSVLWN